MEFWTYMAHRSNKKMDRKHDDRVALLKANHAAYQQADGLLSYTDWVAAMGQPRTPDPSEAAMVDAWLSDDGHPAMLMS